MSGSAGFEMTARSKWADEPYALLSSDAAHLYDWTYENPSVSSSGIFRARREQMELDVKLKGRRLDAAWEELQQHNMAYFTPDGRVWCRARVKNIRGLNKNWAASIVAEVARMHASDPLRIAFVTEYRDFEPLGRCPQWQEVIDETHGFGNPSQTHAEPMGMGSATHEIARGDGESAMGSETHGQPMAMGNHYLYLLFPSSRASRTTGSTRSEGSRGRPREGAGAEAREGSPQHEVFEHYLDCWYPERRGSVPKLADHIHHITPALAVATVEECKLAVTGHSRSNYHRENGHRQIRYALRPTRRGERVRERIEMMIGIAERESGGGNVVDLYAARSPYDTFKNPTEKGA